MTVNLLCSWSFTWYKTEISCWKAPVLNYAALSKKNGVLRRQRLLVQVSFCVCSYFEKGCLKKCARDNPETLQGSDQYTVPDTVTKLLFCFLLALANMRPWPLVSSIQISLKNSELKSTHNTFRDCRVHFSRQPFSK